MVNEQLAKAYCREDISNIENYDKAIADTTQTWSCHHRDEIKNLPSGVTVIRSRKDLKDAGRYFGCPANELIFLTNTEHMKLHKSGKTLSNEHRKRIGEAMKGKTKSEETKRKMSEAARRRYSTKQGMRNNY